MRSIAVSASDEGSWRPPLPDASAHGCQSVWVMSYDFQAPLFYERCGFHRVAELADWPPGHTNIILRHQLQAGAG
jgi:hypothetical protein